MIPRVKGTQDFVDLRLFNSIIDLIKKQLILYHFSEIQTPIVEHLDLFKRSLGLETDVVSKEMFIIESRQEGNEDKICLRPEGTAATVRAFVDNGIQTVPWKVFSYGPMFRYERPQKGRYRQFHQINMEIIGSASISEDVQCLVMLDRFFQEQLSLNNYALVINFLGCGEDRASYQKLLKEFLDADEQLAIICDQCKERKERNIMRIFDCKNPVCQQLYQKAPHITDHLCDSCVQEWQQLQSQLQLLSVSFVHRPTLVRGLDYYNKTVFEFVSKNLGAQDTFCGGGRYNKLAQELGASQDYPSIGAAIGMERLMILLEHSADTLIPVPPALQVIIPMDAAQHSLALLLADDLRSHGLCVDILFEGSVKSMFRKASKLGAAHALVLGETEQKTKTVMVKNMVTGQENPVAQVDVAAYLKG